MAKRVKTELPKFKGKGDPNIFIKEFNHICYVNQDQEERLTLFPVCLKKKA